MGNFVQGILSVDEDPHTGGMDLRLPDKETIRLFYHDLRPREERAEEDPFDQLLESAKWYELLIIAQAGLAAHNEIIYLPSTRLGLACRAIKLSDRVVKEKKVVQGIILDLNWDATSVPYLAVAGQRVYTHHFVLVQTAIGKMVLSYPALQERLGEQVKTLAPGGYLEWGPSRLDILAIIAKHPPKLGSDPFPLQHKDASNEAVSTLSLFDTSKELHV
jgi:hypothetical protein